MSLALSDNKIIASCIETMARLIVARGGFVHPAVCIEVRDGSIRTVCLAPLAVGETLFKVPDTLLVPTDELNWTDSEEKMELASPTSHFSADRAEMLDLFITIYNAAGKLPWLKNHAARVVLRDAGFAAQLALIRPRHFIEAPSPAAELLDTRCYSGKDAQDGMANKRCLMPLIDFMNHHMEGAPYLHGNGFLQANICFADQTEECFSNYGKHRDPLNLALGHGYLDGNSTYVQCVPLKIDLEGFGLLEILGQRFAAKHPADLPKVEFGDDGVNLSHLSGDVRAPHHLHSVLRLAMMASARRRGISDAVTEKAIAELPQAMLEVNRLKLDAFQAYLATRPDLPIATVLSQACQRQLANLTAILGT